MTAPHTTFDTAHAAGIRTFDQGRMLARGQWQFDWSFARNDAAFEGHFPHQPILPAVFLMEMAQRAAEWAMRQELGRRHAVHRIERFRFMQPVLPGEACALLIEWQSEEAPQAHTNIRALFSNARARVAQGVLVATAGDLSHAR